MNGMAFLLAVVVGLLLAETRLSRRNERRLRDLGATTPPGDVYRVLAVLYPTAFLLMGLEGVWRAAQPAAANTAVGPSWLASGVVLFAASKALKFWAIRSLGDCWTFRVFVVPGRTLVTSGPYRYVAHPNYIAVLGELVGAAMMFRAETSGPVMCGLFGVALWARVRFETRILRSLATGRAPEAS